MRLVVAIGGKLGAVADLEIGTEKKQIDQLDTVSIYLRPPIQEMYYDYIISLHPKRVIFNPGAENLAFEQLLATNGIEALEACTLVLLSTNQY